MLPRGIGGVVDHVRRERSLPPHAQLTVGIRQPAETLALEILLLMREQVSGEETRRTEETCASQQVVYTAYTHNTHNTMDTHKRGEEWKRMAYAGGARGRGAAAAPSCCRIHKSKQFRNGGRPQTRCAVLCCAVCVCGEISPSHY